MKKELSGACPFCGQIITALPSYIETEEAANDYAAENCTCGAGAQFRMIRQNQKIGHEYVDELFGAAVKDRGEEPLPGDAREMLKRVVDMVALGIVKASTTIFGTVSAKVMMTSRGELKVIRTKILKEQLGG